jgi:hypothetical protein
MKSATTWQPTICDASNLLNFPLASDWAAIVRRWRCVDHSRNIRAAAMATAPEAAARTRTPRQLRRPTPMNVDRQDRADWSGSCQSATSRARVSISAKSSASTNTSITRTGLLSSMKSSRHSGNSVHCPRSASSTKRLINSPIESRENHNSSTAFSHSQGQTRKSGCATGESALPSRTDIVSRPCPLRKTRLCGNGGLWREADTGQKQAGLQCRRSAAVGSLSKRQFADVDHARRCQYGDFEMIRLDNVCDVARAERDNVNAVSSSQAVIEQSRAT